MVLKRGLGKRGQEGVTLTTLLLIILGAVVVVVIILGATGVFNFIFSKTSDLPGQDFQAIVSSCQITAKTGLTTGYCNQFKLGKINGASQYVTCSSDVVEAQLGADAQTCSGVNAVENASKSFCGGSTITADEWDKTLVDGKTCATWLGGSYSNLCSQQKGTWETGKCSGKKPATHVTDSSLHTGESCCIPS